MRGPYTKMIYTDAIHTLVFFSAIFDTTDMCMPTYSEYIGLGLYQLQVMTKYEESEWSFSIRLVLVG